MTTPASSSGDASAPVALADIGAHIKQYAVADDRRATWVLVQTTLVLLVALALYAVDQVVLAVILDAGIIVRVFIIYHDGIHYSFYRRTEANERLATLLQAWIITPVDFWRRNHSYHHKWFGNLAVFDEADTVFFTRQKYESYPLHKRVLARILRDPIVFFLFAPVAQWWVQYPIQYANPILWLGHAVHLLIAWQLSWWHLFAVYLGAIAGLILFHLQHAVNRGYREPRAEWNPTEASLLGSTYLPIPRPFTWFTFGIQFHHIHHMNTKVPSYALARCHREARPEMWRDVTTPNLWRSLASIRNVMWDEESKQLVPF